MQDALKSIIDSRIELAIEQRGVEADAFAVMRHRPLFFALKLLLGINHKAIEEKPAEEETEPLSIPDQQTVAA